jgi:tagatose-1,6-bisphosphate aldolase non-catalytic subunit AgaZ/GatZ
MLIIGGMVAREEKEEKLGIITLTNRHIMVIKATMELAEQQS